MYPCTSCTFKISYVVSILSILINCKHNVDLERPSVLTFTAYKDKILLSPLMFFRVWDQISEITPDNTVVSVRSRKLTLDQLSDPMGIHSTAITKYLRI